MARFHLGDMTLTSSAFEHGEPIPDRHTVNGEDVSPPLAFGNIPEGTQQLALLCVDPDAPLTYGWDHWVLYGIPPDTSSIPEGGGGAHTQGRNSFGNEGYGGPAPPPGHGTHHYFFHLYALDADPELPAGLTGLELLERIDEHIIQQARLVGCYSR